MSRNSETPSGKQPYKTPHHTAYIKLANQKVQYVINLFEIIIFALQVIVLISF